jgi:hypothetical protein
LLSDVGSGFENQFPPVCPLLVPIEILQVLSKVRDILLCGVPLVFRFAVYDDSIHERLVG